MDNFIGALRICLQFPDAASVLPKVLRGDKLDKGSEKPRRRDPWMALKYITAMGGIKMRYARAFMRRVIITLVRDCGGSSLHRLVVVSSVGGYCPYRTKYRH